MGSAKPVVCIVTPGTRDANNGNWRTASRWAKMLGDRYRVIVQTAWDAKSADAMIALHARRSAPSIRAFRAQASEGGLAVVLTGTDLYEDLPESAEAAGSLDLADRIVVLQEDAPRVLDSRWRGKTEVIFQSASSLPRRAKPRDQLNCVMVGHLRAEKDPLTLFRAVAMLPASLPIHIRHIGAALDPRLGEAARALERRDPRYRYVGALPRGLTRAAIAAAHVLVHPSIVEGGANVIVEAVTGGTAVIASRISGNIGMLGVDYPGYFEPGDESGLAGCLVQAVEDAKYRRALATAAAARKSLFAPRVEARAVHRLAELLTR
ncbi:MAG TPA: selenoneine biosynthesis selenosugar synthase SenB [Usitatibacter sp.]